MKADSIFIKRTLSVGDGAFFMRFFNQTGAAVTVSGLNTLMVNKTGDPVLLTAEVERSGGVVDDVKGVGNSINSFSVANNEACVFRMSWYKGVFSLEGTTSNSYRAIVRSAGYKINGVTAVPSNFMYTLFYASPNYNQQAGDVFDTSNWHVTSIGNNFLGGTWRACPALATAAVPDSSNWRVTSIGNSFLDGTWLFCSSLSTAVAPNTTNWNVVNIGVSFLFNTWQGCTALTTGVVPDSTNWSGASVGSNFLNNTWLNSFAASGNRVLTLKGGLYVTNSPTTNSGSLTDAKITNVKVDAGLIGSYQASANWSNVSDSKFISW